MPKKLTQQQFIEKAKLKHGNKYDYSLVEYINCSDKVNIKCNTCFTIFQQSPDKHMYSGRGCTVCARERTILGRKDTLYSFIEKANKVHTFKYDYSKSIYKNSLTKILIICPIHTEFLQTPSSHLFGRGCPLCKFELIGYTRTNFKNCCIKYNQGLGIFYIIRCFNENEEFYKIGITSSSIEYRYNCFSKMPYKYEIIQEIYDTPEIIYNLETIIHRIYRNLKYQYTPLLSFGGSKTECFKYE